MDYSRMIHFIWNGAGYEMEEYRPSLGTSAVRLKCTIKAPVGATHQTNTARRQGQNQPVFCRRVEGTRDASPVRSGQHHRPIPRITTTKNSGTRRADASVVRSAIDRSGTPARDGSAIVTREASPEPFAQQRTIKTPVGAMHPPSAAQSIAVHAGTIRLGDCHTRGSFAPFRIPPPAKKQHPSPPWTGRGSRGGATAPTHAMPTIAHVCARWLRQPAIGPPDGQGISGSRHPFASRAPDACYAHTDAGIDHA